MSTAQLLRTCSLPDLTKPTGDSPADIQKSHDPGASPSGDDDEDLPRASVASSMNDTNFDENEEVPDVDSDVSAGDEGSVVTDDDEEMDMRVRLQIALQTSEAGDGN